MFTHSKIIHISSSLVSFNDWILVHAHHEWKNRQGFSKLLCELSMGKVYLWRPRTRFVIDRWSPLASRGMPGSEEISRKTILLPGVVPRTENSSTFHTISSTIREQTVDFPLVHEEKWYLVGFPVWGNGTCKL